MAILTLRGVSVYDGNDLTGPSNVVFSASPGDIISSDVDGGEDPEESVDLDTVVEGAGCTLLPALVDCFTNTAAADTDLRLFASFGISTVLDMCSTTSEVEAMRAASESEIGLPSYLASGTVATAETELPDHLYNLRETDALQLPSEADQFVTSRVTGPNRADYIKVLVDTPGLDDATLSALVDAAHRHARLAVAHATQTRAFARALRAGFDVITPVPLNGIVDDDTVNGMAARGVACVPSLCMRQARAPLLRRGAQGGGPFSILSEGIDESGVYDFEYALQNVKKLHAAGVRICAGTEANQTSPSPVSIGESIHGELELLVRAGLSNRDALRAATVVPAEVFGLQGRGSLRPGMRADMILLEGNPLEDIGATRRIRKVCLCLAYGPDTTPPASPLTLSDSPIMEHPSNREIFPGGDDPEAPPQTEVHLRTIFDLLRRSSADESNEILDRIRLAPSVDDFVETFAGSGLLPRVQGTGDSDLSIQAPPGAFLLNNSLSPSLEPLSISGDLVAKSPVGLLPVAQWTTLSVDNRYLTHLLNLFFSWDHTLSRIIHRTMFLKELKSQETSGLKFCSSFLIHSILAVSHLYVSQGVSSRQLDEFRSRGRSFADEALRMLEQDRLNTTIPLAQGLALLWIYEDNYGDQHRATAFLDEFYRVHDALGVSNVEDPAHDVNHSKMEWQALSFVSWGFFCLEVRIALILSREMRIRRPKISKTFADAYSSIFADPEALECSWFPYPNSSRQPSYFRDVMTYECQLAELAWDASCFFALAKEDAPLPDFNAAQTMFDKLLAWNTGITQRFLLNSRLLPSVLFLDTTFEMVLLELLSCLCRFPYYMDGQTMASTRASYGASIISNTWEYRAAHGLRHEYWLKQACFSAASALLPRLGDIPSFSKVIVMACQLLYAMGGYLPAANKCLLAIKVLARKQKVDLPKPCRILFSGLAVRTGKIVLRDVGLIHLGHDAVVPGSVHEVAFSSLIEGIRSLSVVNN
ncbi:hypothetical protein B0T10DRAFT_526067 [Thelonectria olida]|uniref:Amidohydrolase-related domain-containing protein n=1 Tax=Thelonectria olida TaxID=1576542 RepID=A0A9P8WGU3_9HYPO|nr:hypothetical protein B0T10DRAFT_526067 [Thelonectria olida]